MFITEEKLREIFDNRTFSRGLKYFRDGYVEIGIRKGNKLVGRVLGSAPIPYRVKVEITSSGIHSECTCPVGKMCKHGVALSLQWIHNSESIVDGNEFLALLGKKSKEELIEIIDSVIEDEPELLLKFFPKINEPKKNLDAISKSVDYLLRDMDYFAVPGVVRELEKFREMGEKLAKDGYFKDAIDVYLLLVEKGIYAFESGVDDSDGILGDFIMDCIWDFKNAVKHLSEEQKSLLIFRIVDIVDMEDYGLESDEMLLDIATERNIDILRDELLRRMPEEISDFHSEYRRNKLLNLLSGIYEKLGLLDEAVRILKGAALKTDDDYLRIARMLSKCGKDEDAFEYVRRGIKLERENYGLDRLYFRILNALLDKNPKMDVEEAVQVAVDLLSISYFKPDDYHLLRRVFTKAGELERLISKIKQECNANTVMSVLLIEGRTDEAIEYAILSSPKLYPKKLMEVAEIARKVGKYKEAKILILNALKGLREVDASSKELIRFFATSSDRNEMEDAIEHVHSLSVAKALIDFLKNSEYIAKLLKKFLTKLSKDEIKQYAAKIDRNYAIEICQLWINEFINRSHVYYDDVLDVLKKLRDIADKSEWGTYISDFLKANKGKRKLIEKIKDAGLI